MVVFFGYTQINQHPGESGGFMCSRKPRARYIVGIPSSTILYEGNLRFVAWWRWLFNRRQAVAFDRRSWIINPSYWLTGDTPPENFFKN